MKLVNPSNKRKYKILVVGTALAGAAAAFLQGVTCSFPCFRLYTV